MAKQTASQSTKNTPSSKPDALFWDKLGNVNQSVSIELGRADASLDTVLEWTEGALIELDKVAGEPVVVYVNGVPFFRGEVVTVAENFAVRITEIIEEE